jgi:hypothetical protein
MQRVFRTILLVLSALFCACNDSSPAPSSNSAETPKPDSAKPLPDAGAIIQKMITQDGAKDFTAEMRMTSEGADGKRDQVEFRLQRKYSADGASSFMTVLAPKEESDKVILAIEKNGQPTEAFSYLAGLKKLAKMDSARQLGFRGAKVTVQELLGMELGQYSHTAGERVMENGEPLIKIEFKAKPNLNLAFPSITGYFREKDQQPARFDLFDESGQVSKKMVFEEIKPVQNHQTISRVAIEDLAQKLKLKLETRKIEYDKGLSDKIFTENNLKASVTSASQRLDVGR